MFSIAPPAYRSPFACSPDQIADLAADDTDTLSLWKDLNCGIPGHIACRERDDQIVAPRDGPGSQSRCAILGLDLSGRSVIVAAQHGAANEAMLMFFPWYTTMMLAMESNSVIGLRLIKMAGGGSDAYDEAHLMVHEKVAALFEAGVTLMTGGSATTVIDRYREHVAANSERLTDHAFATG